MSFIVVLIGFVIVIVIVIDIFIGIVIFIVIVFIVIVIVVVVVIVIVIAVIVVFVIVIVIAIGIFIVVVIAMYRLSLSLSLSRVDQVVVSYVRATIVAEATNGTFGKNKLAKFIATDDPVASADTAGGSLMVMKSASSLCPNIPLVFSR